jgi:pyridoxal 5'-phosphate synthase pdxT subunit
MMLQIGIFAPHGGCDEHKERLEEAYGDGVAVGDADSLAELAGLVISGPDAAALLESLRASNLFGRLREFGQQKPILETGAGACLIAQEVKSPVQESLGLIDMGVECTGYEGQIDRLTEPLRHEFDDESGALNAVFIRPPGIRWAGPEVKLLANYQGHPVLVEEGLHMAATFHPELSRDRRIYFHFVDKVRESYWKLRLKK